jgi:hypothetical protein
MNANRDFETPEAFERVAGRGKRGKVVLEVGSD